MSKLPALSIRPIYDHAGKAKQTGFWIDADLGEPHGRVGLCQVHLTEPRTRRAHPQLQQIALQMLVALGIATEESPVLLGVQQGQS